MKLAVSRAALIPALVAGGFILLDLALDRWIAGPATLNLPHILLALCLILIAYVFASRAIETRRAAEAALRHERDEMETRVHERTAQLESANEALQAQIVDRQRTEAQIKHLSSFPQLNPNPVIEVDALGSVTYCNPAAMAILRKLGLEEDPRVLLPSDLPEALEELKRSGGQLCCREVRLAGIVLEERVHLVPVLGTARLYALDVTERKRMEDALRASEEKYRLLFENMAEGFALYELLFDEVGEPADWRILDVNHAYTRHTGLDRDHILGRQASELFPEAIPDYLPRFAAVVATQTPAVMETYAKAVDRYQRVFTFPGGDHRFASTIEDISERKRADEALRRTQLDLARISQERARTEERQHLARELHDSISQALYGVSLGVNTALTLLDADRTRVLEALHYALSQAHAGLTEMRALIFQLRPESLELEGLVVALTKQAAALRASRGMEVALSVCAEPDVPLLVKEALFRIAQQALDNAAKHSRADRLDVRLACEPDGLELEVFDNGVGFDPQTVRPGHLGLQSMRERAMGVGGTLDVTGSQGRGTQIRARVPIPATEPA
jgi:PAS domain S-box-containing protein